MSLFFIVASLRPVMKALASEKTFKVLTSILAFSLAQHYQICLCMITAIKAKQKLSAKLFGLSDANRCFQSATMKLDISRSSHEREEVECRMAVTSGGHKYITRWGTLAVASPEISISLTSENASQLFFTYLSQTFL